MARYNETLLRSARTQVDCVDAASLLPRDTTTMYDDIHFNEKRIPLARRVLVEHFRGRPPLRF